MRPSMIREISEKYQRERTRGEVETFKIVIKAFEVMANEENLIPFKKGQSGNPAGRPKKHFKQINDKLQEEGYQKLKRQDLIDAYALIFNCDQAKLNELVQDKDAPYALRLMIMEMSGDKKFRMAALKDYRDYMFGKAKETVENVHIEQPLYGDDPEVNEYRNKK